MLQRQALFQISCPIKLKVCSSCYWRKKGKWHPAGEQCMRGLGEQEKEVTTEFSLLRSRLESERKRLMKEFEQLKTNVRPERREGSPFGKREEEATETIELEKRLALEARMIDRLSEVEHALHKFKEGTYGLCDACGQPIDPARLEALPQASLCLGCKAHQPRNTKSRLSPRGIG